MARWLALIAITQLISCGTGKSPATSNFDPGTTVTVTISPRSAQISPGAAVQFLVTVQNASNPAVTWQVNGLPGGNSSVGTITPAGAATASYTAPASVPASLTVTVTAVLQADTTKSGSASVTINPLPGPQISVSPSNVTVVAGASQQFNATVQNGPQAVIWEVDGMQLGNTTVGSITSSGFYTAPAKIPSPAVVTITAVLVTDSLISGSTTVTIIPPPVSVSISPSTANLALGQTLQLTAIVQNSTAPVTWQAIGPVGSPAGTIVSTGTDTASYTAPASIPASPSPFTVTITAVLQTSPPISTSAGVTISQPGAFTGVYSWRNDNSLTGQNSQETVLTPASVSNTTSPTFGKLFRCSVDGAIFAQPLYVSNVTIPNLGTHNVVYVATEHDSVYALDADANPCQTLWQASFINPAAGVTTVPANDLSPQQDIVPEIGITGTPVIDPATATLYVVAKTKENGAYFQRLHALDLVTGTEKFAGPAVIKVPPSNVAFDTLTENQRSALLLAGGKVYVAFDSYADTDPFHGWLFAYNAADLQTAPAVFNSTPNGSHGGIGESGAAPSADATGNIFVATSDGTFDSFSDYAETLLKLQINTGATSLTVTDSFTPWNEVTLNSSQKYFGSTGVLLLPGSAGGTLPLALAGNGAGSLYLLDRGNLGGFTLGGPDKVVQTLCITANGASGAPASILGTPAYWANNNAVYVAAADDTLKAFPLASGAFTSPICPAAAVPSSQSTDIFSFFGGSFGASPVISWDGSNASSGIIWALDTSGYSGNVATSSPAILHAYNATNLATELYTSASTGSGAAGPAIKFAVPTVANGKVYVGTQGELSVFGLP